MSRVELTTEEILDLLDSADAGPDTLVRHVEALLQDHRDEAIVMADIAAGGFEVCS